VATWEDLTEEDKKALFMSLRESPVDVEPFLKYLGDPITPEDKAFLQLFRDDPEASKLPSYLKDLLYRHERELTTGLKFLHGDRSSTHASELPVVEGPANLLHRTNSTMPHTPMHDEEVSLRNALKDIEPKGFPQSLRAAGSGSMVERLSDQQVGAIQQLKSALGGAELANEIEEADALQEVLDNLAQVARDPDPGLLSPENAALLLRQYDTLKEINREAPTKEELGSMSDLMDRFLNAIYGPLPTETPLVPRHNIRPEPDAPPLVPVGERGPDFFDFRSRRPRYGHLTQGSGTGALGPLADDP